MCDQYPPSPHPADISYLAFVSSPPVPRLSAVPVQGKQSNGDWSDLSWYLIMAQWGSYSRLWKAALCRHHYKKINELVLASYTQWHFLSNNTVELLAVLDLNMVIRKSEYQFKQYCVWIWKNIDFVLTTFHVKLVSFASRCHVCFCVHWIHH